MSTEPKAAIVAEMEKALEKMKAERENAVEEAATKAANEAALQYDTEIEKMEAALELMQGVTGLPASKRGRGRPKGSGAQISGRGGARPNAGRKPGNKNLLPAKIGVRRNPSRD
jgi:predicted RecB family endonuclease